MQHDESSRLPLRIAFGLVLGVLTGFLLNIFNLGSSFAWIGDLGKVVIQLIKIFATPVLFFSILNAILKSGVELKSGMRMIGVAGINACLAMCIALTIANVIEPGKYLNGLSQAETDSAKSVLSKKLELSNTLTNLVPSGLFEPFVQNNVLSIVLLTLLFGFALRKVKSNQGQYQQTMAQLESQFEVLSLSVQVILGWVIKLIPIAVFAVVTKSVAENGFAPLKGLGVYIGVCILGLSIQVLLVYQTWIAFIAKMSLKKFWTKAKNPVVYAMGANSSLATLPVTLESLDQLNVSKSASAVGACVGTNLNNDGILLYEAMAVLFVAQAYGIDLSLSQQFFAALMCLVAAIGIAGIPEAGFISLSLVLSTVGLPVEILPLLLSVDWIVARARSVTNVLSDMVVSISIDQSR